MDKNIIYVDRSRLETHWRCPRRRWWNYDAYGTGIAPVDTAWSLTFGIICHEGAADLMIYFVECATQFCVDYQYLDDEPLCRTLLNMFDRAVRAALELPEADRDGFRLRLHEIVDSSTDMMWGYHEELCDIYDDAFPNHPLKPGKISCDIS